MFFFEENERVRINIGSVEYGYLSILNDDLKAAKVVFSGLDSPRAKWGISLVEILEEYLVDFPNFFGIRNFLEIDMDILITYCKGSELEKIIKYADFMANYNIECYKFMGRAFWAHNLTGAAMFFFNRAKDRMYNDPELHYLLGYINYYDDKNIAKSINELKICLSILPDYNPAVKLLNKINSK